MLIFYGVESRSNCFLKSEATFDVYKNKFKIVNFILVFTGSILLHVFNMLPNEVIALGE